MTYPPPPLDYSLPRGGRPGIVTAIGVLSILFGALGVLSGLWGSLTYGAMLFFMQSSSATFAFTPAPATTLPTTGPAATMNVSSWTVGTGLNPSSTSNSTAPTTTPTTTPTPTTTTATATATTVTLPPLVASPFAGTSRPVLLLVALTSFLGLLLGAGLLTLGVMVLRDSRDALVMHRWYVRLKPPLVLISSAAALAMTWSMVQNINAAMAATPPPAGTPAMPAWSNGMMFGMMSISTIFSAALGLAYPVGLFFALRGRAVREYCSPVRD